MAKETRESRSYWAFRCGVCGQTTTVLVTAAQRQRARRRASSPLLSGLLLLLSRSLLLLGCAGAVTATPIHRPPRPLVPRVPSSVQVLAAEPPSEPHVSVALLQLDQHDSQGGQLTAEMIQRLREKAAELGCDAVYLQNTARALASCLVFTPPDSSREVEAEIANTQKR